MGRICEGCEGAEGCFAQHRVRPLEALYQRWDGLAILKLRQGRDHQDTDLRGLVEQAQEHGHGAFILEGNQRLYRTGPHTHILMLERLDQTVEDPLVLLQKLNRRTAEGRILLLEEA